jgi:3-isopropylmalate dehydrogenase
MGLYEPIHGSAPDIAGRGVANPVGTILSVAMLLRHSLGLEAEARAVESATFAVVAEGCVTADVAPEGTRGRATDEVGRAIAARVCAREEPVSTREQTIAAAAPVAPPPPRDAAY